MTFDPREVRLSEVARGCQRMSFLRAIGAEASQPDSEQEQWFARGAVFEEYVVRQLVAKHGKDNVARQVIVRHPLGTGHADALIRSERLLVEVKSSTSGSLSTPVFENGVSQLKLYLYYSQDVADSGALYLINPSTLKPADVFQVRLCDEDREDIAAMMSELEHAIGSGDIPDRVCARPSQARGMLCPFAQACFEGWEEPALDQITDPRALQITSALARVKKQEQEHRRALAALEVERKDCESDLAEWVPVGSSVVGGYKVTRTHVRKQPVFSAKAFVAAGHSLEPLAEFMQPGAEYDLWKITQADQAGDVDFGERAPF